LFLLAWRVVKCSDVGLWNRTPTPFFADPVFRIVAPTQAWREGRSILRASHGA
jgi:hypothetical protein